MHKSSTTRNTNVVHELYQTLMALIIDKWLCHLVERVWPLKSKLRIFIDSTGIQLLVNKFYIIN